MGVPGLLPLMAPAMSHADLSALAGMVVAIDTSYLFYKFDGSFLRMWNSLSPEFARHNIKPIFIFDGPHPQVKDEAIRRRIAAKQNNAGSGNLGTPTTTKKHDLAKEWAMKLKHHGASYIFSPAESDAQMAYMANKGYAHAILCYDSDLILYGSEKIFFGLDKKNEGSFYQKSDFAKALKGPYNQDLMTALSLCSGQDYVPGGYLNFGIQKMQPVYRALAKEPFDYDQMMDTIKNLTNLKGPQQGFKEKFERGMDGFKYQPVLDPTTSQILPLNPYPPGMTAQHFTHAGVIGSLPEFHLSFTLSVNPPILAPIQGSSSSSSIARPVNPSPLPKLVSCADCPKTFSSILEKDRHRREEHPHICPECHRQFYKASDLRDHMAIHEGKVFNCDLCSTVHSSQQALLKHNKTYHSGKNGKDRATMSRKKSQQSFTCETCSAVFGDLSKLNVHALKEHGAMQAPEGFVVTKLPNGEDVYKCKVCSKEFKDRKRAQSHPSSHIILTCEKCGTKVPRSTFKKHMGSCSGQSHTCETCSAVFGSLQKLSIHALKEHGAMQAPKGFVMAKLPNEEDVYKCKICSKEFKDRKNAQSHSSTHIKSTCEICGTQMVKTSMTAHIKRCSRNRSK